MIKVVKLLGVLIIAVHVCALSYFHLSSACLLVYLFDMSLSPSAVLFGGVL
jgi:hypothetical protein